MDGIPVFLFYLPKSLCLPWALFRSVFLAHTRNQTDPPRKLKSLCNRWGILDHKASLQWWTQPELQSLSVFHWVTLRHVIQQPRRQQGATIHLSSLLPIIQFQLFGLGKGLFATRCERKSTTKGKITTNWFDSLSMSVLVNMLLYTYGSTQIVHWLFR